MTVASAAPTVKSFPSPSSLPVPEGAEGWEKLYPYYLTFDNDAGSDDEKFWFCDSQHWPTAYKPFETIGGEFAVKCLGQYNTRHLLIPPANGIEFKIHLGYLYMSPVPPVPPRGPDPPRPRAGVRAARRPLLPELGQPARPVEGKGPLDDPGDGDSRVLPRCRTWCRSTTSSRARPRTAAKSSWRTTTG